MKITKVLSVINPDLGFIFLSAMEKQGCATALATYSVLEFVGAAPIAASDMLHFIMKNPGSAERITSDPVLSFLRKVGEPASMAYFGMLDIDPTGNLEAMTGASVINSGVEAQLAKCNVHEAMTFF